MKVLVIGAVGTTALTIEMLNKHGFDIVGVLGHEPINKNRVSGLNDLDSLCLSLRIEYQGYQNINNTDHIAWAQAKKPDVIFAVGFSQLLNQQWLTMPTKGCIGFHPTVLPQGRGRAPVAWTIIEGKNGAANFFLMGEGADDGPIFIQEIFELTDADDAESFVPKLRKAIVKALDRWLPELKSGEWNPQYQDESKATYYGKREPCDSLINWNKSAIEIDRLIKASAKPHPGAFTFFKDNLITIWKSRINQTDSFIGVVGRILMIKENMLLIQCGEKSSIWLENYDVSENILLKTGDKFGGLEQNKMDEHLNNLIWKKNEQ
jgi:methionyl-tRNA formyltransferase